jgi:hypothetical protein
MPIVQHTIGHASLATTSRDTHVCGVTRPLAIWRREPSNQHKVSRFPRSRKTGEWAKGKPNADGAAPPAVPAAAGRAAAPAGNTLALAQAHAREGTRIEPVLRAI